MQKKILHRNRYYMETENNTLPLQTTSVQECRDMKKINRKTKKICEGCDRSLAKVHPCWSRPKKGGTVVSRRKERARMVCERRSPEGQNRAGRGRASEEVC